MSHTTYVEPYVKSDGTKVRGHVRHVRGKEGGRRQGHGGARGAGRQGERDRRQDAGASQPGPGDGRQPQQWTALPNDWRSQVSPTEGAPSGVPDARAVDRIVTTTRHGADAVAPRDAPRPSPEDVAAAMSDPQVQEELVATFKHGQVSRTPGQTKWLAAEMDRQELERITREYDDSVIYSNKVVYMSGHLREKIGRGELSVPRDVVEQTIATFRDSFVEYSVTEWNGKESRRVLLRNYDIVRDVRVRGRTQPANLCIVLDIDTCCMVTAYWNAVDDHHANLDRSRYEHGDRQQGQQRAQGQQQPQGRRQPQGQQQRQGQRQPQGQQQPRGQRQQPSQQQERRQRQGQEDDQPARPPRKRQRHRGHRP